LFIVRLGLRKTNQINEREEGEGMMEKPKADYYRWKSSKRKDWLHKATHYHNDFGLRSAFYAGYTKGKEKEARE